MHEILPWSDDDAIFIPYLYLTPRQVNHMTEQNEIFSLGYILWFQGRIQEILIKCPEIGVVC